MAKKQSRGWFTLIALALGAIGRERASAGSTPSLETCDRQGWGSHCRLLRVCVLICVFGGPLSAATLDRGAFTFTHYDLHVRLALEEQGLAARGSVTLRNDSSTPQTVAALQVSSTLGWRMIESGGRLLQFVSQEYQSDIDHTGAVREAIVTLPYPVAPRETVTLDIGYIGTIPADATRLKRIGTPDEPAARNDWDQISEEFTAVRGLGYVCWYPMAMESVSLSDGPSFSRAIGGWKRRHARSSMRLSIAVESEKTVLANGEMIAQRAAGSSEPDMPPVRESVFEFTAFGPRVPTFAVGNYNMLSRPAINISYLGDNKAAGEEYALAAEKVLPFVSDWFGAPREKVQIIELAANAAPFEDGVLLFTPLRTLDKKALELNMAHQLVHAAFVSERPWVYEGLAHFAQALQREQQDGRSAALAYMSSFLPALRAVEKEGAQPLVASADEVLYRVKAMYVWWMLRDMVGDETLQRALAAYRAAQDNEPSYVQRLVQRAAKRDLEWFFDDWVYRDRGLPEFRVVAASQRALLRGEISVAVTVENLGEAAAEVPVGVRTVSGDVFKRVLVRGKAKATERIQVAVEPSEAIVNDGSVPEASAGEHSLKIAQ